MPAPREPGGRRLVFEDAAETTDRAGASPSFAAEYERRLKEWRERTAARALKNVPLTPEELKSITENLKKLGYLAEPEPQPGPKPGEEAHDGDQDGK